MRLDQLLVQKGLAETRKKAQALIMAGHVEVAGQKADKPGRRLDSDAGIVIKNRYPPYVSRGGLKLEAGLAHFRVDPRGLVLLDAGSSTGGFTDCLLQHGAKRVIAVDVGYGQLDWRLRQDPRVVVLEKTNLRYLKPEDLEGPVHGATLDVSFISLKLVVPPVSKLITETGFIMALVKPQFEVGREHVGKGGVVRDPRRHQEVLENLSVFFKNLDWTVQGTLPSPLLGPKGNREFLMYLTR